jgi:hypothetical protein
MLAGLMAQTSASQPAINGIINGACALYQDVRIAILITGVVLILIGGALYAIGHLVSGEDHAVNGYGIGLAIAGIIAVIIAVLAPLILALVTGAPLNSNLFGCTNSGL